MRIEEWIQTPAPRCTKRRLSFTKAQFFCVGVSGAALAGTVDAWWKSGYVAVLFLVLALILGVCKVAFCRRPRRTYIVPPIVRPTGGGEPVGDLEDGKNCWR